MTMTDDTLPQAVTAEDPPARATGYHGADPSLRLTPGEALLAADVAWLEQQLTDLHHAVASLYNSLSTRPREDAWIDVHRWLYTDHMDVTVDGRAIQIEQRPAPPIPIHWLDEMAHSGRSLAQVAGSKAEAARYLGKAALNSWRCRKRCH